MRRKISLFILVVFTFTLMPNIIFASGKNFASDVVVDETIIEPKDPILCTVIAVGPGLLAHGFGNFYAEDYRMGLVLFGVEVISILTIGTGYIIYKAPGNFTSLGGDYGAAERGGMVTLATGIGLFLVSWLADIATAGRAAEQFNQEHHLEFKLQQESFAPTLNYTYNF